MESLCPQGRSDSLNLLINACIQEGKSKKDIEETYASMSKEIFDCEICMNDCTNGNSIVIYYYNELLK